MALKMRLKMELKVKKKTYSIISWNITCCDINCCNMTCFNIMWFYWLQANVPSEMLHVWFPEILGSYFFFVFPTSFLVTLILNDVICIFQLLHFKIWSSNSPIFKALIGGQFSACKYSNASFLIKIIVLIITKIIKFQNAVFTQSIKCSNNKSMSYKYQPIFSS